MEIVDFIIDYHHHHHADILEFHYTNCSNQDNEAIIWKDSKKYRTQDWKEIYAHNVSLGSLKYDIHHHNKEESLLSICRSIFLCLILMIGSMIISKDAQELVLRPLEYIMEKVNKLA